MRLKVSGAHGELVGSVFSGASLVVGTCVDVAVAIVVVEEWGVDVVTAHSVKGMQ